jgi:hypothetical protein
VTELETEEGKTKKITSAYLVEAMSFTEVESIVNAEYRNAPHPFSIKSVTEIFSFHYKSSQIQLN